MNIEKFQDNLDKTVDNIKSYVNLRSELFKITVFERIAKVLTSLFTLIILIFVLFFIMLFLSLAFIYWYQENGGQQIHGYLLVALFYFFIGIIIFLLSKRLFLNPMIKGFSNTAFEEDEELIDKGKKGSK
jgi:ABC-type multidrug transport system fused ATPase/permease subunit